MCDNALAVQGLQRFADALTEIDPPAGRKYREEAEAFHADLRRAVDREAALSPVRRGRDGVCRSFIPRMAYARGLTGPELGAPQFPDCDMFMGALPLAEPFGPIAADDPRMVGTLDVMEELGTSVKAVRGERGGPAAKGLPTEDAWFWHGYVILPKASHNANMYLLQDDVPNFLRFWMNSYALDGRVRRQALGALAPGRLRRLQRSRQRHRGLVHGELPQLVGDGGRRFVVGGAGNAPRLARAGQTIAVSNAPTYFGTLAYEIVSDVDSGRSPRLSRLPDRNPPERVIVRLRHPKAAPIKSVTVNGQPWSQFDSAKEVIRLRGLKEAVVVASY